MGRDKKAQRTKGNKQPASSGRTASILDGSPGAGLVGFSSLQDLGYVPAASQATLDPHAVISAQFRLTLRKMTKKDSTTKIKALQEFEGLCVSEDQASVLSALPFWPRLYCKLAIDVERRVREAAQVCHGALCSRVGKQLAPHLRTVMPTWVLAMVDPHTPAAIAANRAFKESFSEDKRGEVLVFSMREIVDHLSDNLFTQTPQTLSDPKNTEPEDMKNKHARVQSCSLLALSLVVRNTTTHSQQVTEALSPLINTPPFWKFAKNKNLLVRHAFFSVVCDLLQHCPALLESSEGELSSSILPALDDQDSTVLPRVWEAFLHLSLKCHGFWNEKNSKSSFKRILSVLREGGRGSGGELYHHLLPILSVLPSEAAESYTVMYTDFFRAMSSGLLKQRVLNSQRDTAAIITALFECLRYTAKKEQNNAHLWDTLVKYQMVELLKSAVTDTPQLHTSNLYREVGSFLRCLSGGPRRDLGALFWRLFLPECEAVVSRNSPGEVEKLTVFFRVLKDPKSKLSQRREGVRFSDELESRSVRRKLSSGKENVNLEAGMMPEDVGKENVHPQIQPVRESSTESGTETDTSMKGDGKEEVFVGETGNHLARLTAFCHRVYITRGSMRVFEVFSVLLSSFPSPKVYTTLVYRSESWMVEVDETHREMTMTIEEEDEDITRETAGPEPTQRGREVKEGETEDGDSENRKLEQERKETEKVERQNRLLEEMRKDIDEIERAVENGKVQEASARKVVEQIILPKMEGGRAGRFYAKIAQPTITLFMSLYQCLSAEERKAVLRGLKPTVSVCALRLLMQELSEVRETDDAASSWLLSGQLGSRLVQLVDCLCLQSLHIYHTEEREELMALFNFVLSNGNKKEPLISLDYISQILTKLSTSLKSDAPGDGQTVTLVANLAGRLFTSYVCWQTKGIQEFMRSLFLLLCQSSKSLKGQTVQILKATFLKGFEGLLASVASDDAGKVSMGSCLVADDAGKASEGSCPVADDAGKVSKEGSSPGADDGEEGSVLVHDDADKVFAEGGCLVTTLKDIRRIVMEDDCSFQLAVTMADLTRSLMLLVFKQFSEDDCCIILDHGRIQTMLDILAPTEGEWFGLESRMSPLYMVPSVIQGIVSFSEFPFPKYVGDCLPYDFGHARLSMFLCDLLLFLSQSGSKERVRVDERTDRSRETSVEGEKDVKEEREETRGVETERRSMDKEDFKDREEPSSADTETTPEDNEEISSEESEESEEGLNAKESPEVEEAEEGDNISSDIELKAEETDSEEREIESSDKEGTSADSELQTPEDKSNKELKKAEKQQSEERGAAKEESEERRLSEERQQQKKGEGKSEERGEKKSEEREERKSEERRESKFVGRRERKSEERRERKSEERGERKSEEREEEVSLGQYTHLVVSALHSTCHATVTQDLINAVRKNTLSEDVKMGIGKLKVDMRRLMKKLNQGNKRLITKQICNRCSDGSSGWCVTLTKVLSEWMTSQDVNATKLLQGLDDATLGYTATKQSLLPYLPQGTALDILAEATGLISSLAEDPFSAGPSVNVAAAALATLPQELTADVVDSLFSVLAQWRDGANTVFLFATELKNVVWEDITLTCSLVRLLTILVKRHWKHLQSSHWDLLLCSMSSWVQSLSDSKQSVHKETVVCAFVCAVCKCVGCVGEVMTRTEDLPAQLKDDWTEFFAQPIYETMIRLFVDVANAYKASPSVIMYSVCRCVSVGVYQAREGDLADNTLPQLPSSSSASLKEWPTMKLPLMQQKLLSNLAPLLMSSQPSVQYAAYILLETALPDIMKSWESNKLAVSEEEDAPQRPLPHNIIDVINKCSDDVEEAYGGTEEGEEGVVVSSTATTPTFKTLGYFLAWRLILNALSHTSDQHHHQYTAYLRQSQLLPHLLTNVFQVMPSRPVMDSGGGRGEGSDTKNATTMFNTPLNITPLELVTSQSLSHLACKVYYECVSRIPAAVRHWFGCLDRHSHTDVDTFTATYVSPLLIAQEFSALNASAKFDNMTIRTRAGAREVVASYNIDQGSGDTSKVLEITLRLAHNHPLSTITVENHRRVGVSLAQWRNWLLGLNTMLQHRNTPLSQSLAFWRQNVDQKFRGLEECYICYYVLHGTNHQLPKLLCRTCKKKFHSACLYKWFNSSNNSTCPLCRSLF